MRIPLVGESYPDRSLATSAQACINLYPEIIEDPNEKEKNIAVLYGAPGKHPFATLATDVRGLWSGAGRLFVASGLNEIELSSAGAVISTHAYAASDDGLPVQIFSNGIQLLIITGGFAYCDNGSGPALIHTDPYAGTVDVVGTAIIWQSGDQFLDDGTWVGSTIFIAGLPFFVTNLPSPPTKTLLFVTSAPTAGSNIAYTHVGEALTAVSGAYLDGTFFVQRPPTVGQTNYGRQVNFSALMDGTSWSGLDFFSKESNPDNLRGLHSDNEQLYLFGAETFEVWQGNPNAGPDDNPFNRIPGGTGMFGMFSTWSSVSLGGSVYFLGTDANGQIIAYQMQGFTPVRVSTHGVEAAWNSAGFPAGQAVTYAYSEEGQSFWCINFGSQTWCYHPLTGAWTQRQKWNGSAFTPYQTNLHTFIPEWTSPSGRVGMHITACTFGTAKVYEASVNFYDDEGTDICWQRALSYLYAGGKRQYFGRLDLEMETGTAPSGTPVVTLDYSDDRGVTFINARTAGTGVTTAQSGLRVWWNRNGSSFRRIFRLTGVGQTKVALIDLPCEITIGTS